jgi:hypothetical protein
VTHSSTTFSPPTTLLSLSAPTLTKEADLVAKAIEEGRPFASPSELASVMNSDGKLVFGNPFLYPTYTSSGTPNITQIQWSDAAAEELFGRVFESATVRSRNFRVWVIGQAIAPTLATTTTPEILGEMRRAYTIFVDPGVRKTDGSIDVSKFKITTLHENDF